MWNSFLKLFGIRNDWLMVASFSGIIHWDKGTDNYQPERYTLMFLRNSKGRRRIKFATPNKFKNSKSVMWIYKDIAAPWIENLIEWQEIPTYEDALKGRVQFWADEDSVTFHPKGIGIKINKESNPTQAPDKKENGSNIIPFPTKK